MTDLFTIDHPSVWTAQELVQREEWNLALSPPEVAELLQAAQAFESVFATNLPTQIPDDVSHVELPVLGPKLALIQQQLEHGSGAARLTGFPACETPLRVAQVAFLILASKLGTPVSQSAQGERIFSVRDAGLADGDQQKRGPNSRKRLSFHTDRCDVIAFLCYRQAKTGGENEVVSSPRLYNEMLKERPDVVETLMQTYLYQRHNVDRGNELPFVEQPIFSFCEGHFAANLLRVLIERAYALPETPDMSSKQREALDLLEQKAESSISKLRFRQSAGDMLFLNNFVTFHRRTEFHDHEELERRRHLFRVWLSVPNSRPLDPRFKGNYGATQAGAIRGGMKPLGPGDGSIV